MYTWGYIKENILSKLNLDETSANEFGFLSRFPYYANEAMTQICSAIKPHEKILQIEVLDRKEAWSKLTEEMHVYCDCIEHDEEILDEDVDDYEIKKEFWKKWKSLFFVNSIITFPKDFVAFSDDVIEFKSKPFLINGQIIYQPTFIEVNDEFVQYQGYNQIICNEIGIYKIPYKARWFLFTKDMPNNIEISAPADICDAIPFYIVSQCLKIDDETKSAIFYNLYEIALARIDDSSFKRQRTLTIGGGW